jgi:hypothetical protein
MILYVQAKGTHPSWVGTGKKKTPLAKSLLSLLYVTFNSRRYLPYRFCLVDKDLSVPFFPKVPEGVYHYAI